MKMIPRSSWREVPVPVFMKECPVYNPSNRLNGSTRRTFSRDRTRDPRLVREILHVWSSGEIHQNSTHGVVSWENSTEADSTVNFTRFINHEPHMQLPSGYSERYRDTSCYKNAISTKMASPSVRATSRFLFTTNDHLRGDLTCLSYHLMTGGDSSCSSFLSRWGMQLSRTPVASDGVAVFLEDTLELLS